MQLEITEEKLRKLTPIFESILSRKYGKDINFKSLTMANVTVNKDK